MSTMYNPPHPGGTLKEALLSIPMTVTEFAAYLGVSRNTLSRVLSEKAGITAAMSIRISEALGQPSRDIWFKMQNAHDFWQASKARRIKIKPLKLAA